MNHPAPIVSIGMPVLNGEHGIAAAAMKSLLAQDFEDIELLISDNASTDATSEICQSFARMDRRVRYDRLPKNLSAPMGISGLSGRSNGVAGIYLRGQSPIAEEFRRLNALGDHAPHPSVPDLPMMASLVADAFQRAKDALFSRDATLVLDRRTVLERCVADLSAADLAGWPAIADAIRKALADDAALLAWFEGAYGDRGPAPSERPSRPVLRRYGGIYLHLDAAEFGVSDSVGVAQLVEKLLGYKADGVNAHLAPAATAKAEPPGRVTGGLRRLAARVRRGLRAPDGPSL